MRVLAFAVALAAASPAAGQVVSLEPAATVVTVYRIGHFPGPDEEVRLDDLDVLEGLAMIRETRIVDVPAGRSRILFRGVADTMIPQTAAVEGLPGALVERNQDYNLLTPGALIEAAVGQEVTLVRQTPGGGPETRERAVVRSGAQGPVLDFGGRMEALGCSRWHERIVFDEVPLALTERPTFSVLADVPTAGRYRIALSYLATGLAWSADYVARIAPNERTLDLTGWVTLANQTSISFANAPTDVVAGTLERDDETAPPEVEPTVLQNNCWSTGTRARVEEIVQTAYAMAPMPSPPAGGVEEVVVTGTMARQTDLGDYKLYTLPEPTTVASRQTKQVMFLDQKAVPFERLYAYRFDWDEYDEEEKPAPTVVLRLRNEKAAGLGKPLPSGGVAVLEPSAAGAPVLAGQWRVKDTPVGLPVELELGRAMDVSVEVSVVEDSSSLNKSIGEIEVTFSNDKPIPITIEYRQAQPYIVSRASRRPGRKNGDAIWRLKLDPGESQTLRYRLEYPDT
jgi:hypothetical protein